jgi:hypothetical protein
MKLKRKARGWLTFLSALALCAGLALATPCPVSARAVLGPGSAVAGDPDGPSDLSAPNLGEEHHRSLTGSPTVSAARNPREIVTSPFANFNWLRLVLKLLLVAGR